MSFGEIRTPGIRTVLVLFFAGWSMALALPECHVFATHAAGTHLHVHDSEANAGPQEALAVRPHQHLDEPDPHLPADAVLATLPRTSNNPFDPLGLAGTTTSAPTATSGVGPGIRGPPISSLVAPSGRDLLIQFGIDRN